MTHHHSDAPPPPNRRRVLGLLGAGAAVVTVGGAGRTLRLSDTQGAGAQDAGPAVRSPTTAATAPAGAATTTSSTTTTTTEPTPTTGPEIDDDPSAGSTTDPATDAEPAPEPADPLDQDEVSAHFEPMVGEVEADAKRTAGRLLEVLTTYGPDRDHEAAVHRALEWTHAPLGTDRLLERLGPMLVVGVASAGHIVYPQLGGLAPHHGAHRCSVMVVVEQHLGTGADTRTVSRCVDVRLRRGPRGRWELEDLGDASGPEVVTPAELPEPSVAVLNHPGIWMPDSVRWDIYEQRIDHRVLTELRLLADRAPIGVSSCLRGHPEHVFGTGRLSSHMVGRAVDVWAVDGPVVQQRAEGSSAHLLTRELFDAGRVDNLGSPWQFGGAGRRSFTDPVHQDHLHLGFS